MAVSDAALAQQHKFIDVEDLACHRMTLNLGILVWGARCVVRFFAFPTHAYASKSIGARDGVQY